MRGGAEERRDIVDQERLSGSDPAMEGDETLHEFATLLPDT